MQIGDGDEIGHSSEKPPHVDCGVAETEITATNNQLDGADLKHSSGEAFASTSLQIADQRIVEIALGRRPPGPSLSGILLPLQPVVALAFTAALSEACPLGHADEERSNSRKVRDDLKSSMIWKRLRRLCGRRWISN